ncbi:MAG: glucosamine-6-phosphate deaminase [Streptococcus orisratti]|uniref:glucosamine-6-phosphate deaminase n=1 Tax=Streptococcus orisratti TaxID=114652 RepID=UPI00235682C5|nr:glucosamine-6-phosphate deaminase [Streptococcus orisratti]MCI7677609.1 glucosamine-6-phosphate deaminase [Streptococcus orisratti]
MKLVIVKNKEEGGKLAFSLLKEKLDAGAKTLGLATGSTPLSFYKAITSSDIDFSKITSLNLDEYVGLSADNPQSYAHFMQEHLFAIKPFKESFLPNGLAIDLQAETQRYEELIAMHPIDFQILGIGRNGHIGFNEPGTLFNSLTHVVDLADNTIQANSRFFEKLEDVPKQAISMGIASIMKSKTIVLMAYGAEKAEAVNQMLHGPITEDLPASILQTHPDVIVIVDKAAAGQE